MGNMLNNINEGKLPIIFGSVCSILGDGFTQDLVKTMIFAFIGATIGYFTKVLYDIIFKKYLKKNNSK